MHSSSSLATLAVALLPLLAQARTDLSGCISTVAGPSLIWYVPGTGELCQFVDCGGGRAPPKTVPGCPLYQGTETVTPSYLPGFAAAATTPGNLETIPGPATTTESGVPTLTPSDLLLTDSSSTVTNPPVIASSTTVPVVSTATSDGITSVTTSSLTAVGAATGQSQASVAVSSASNGSSTLTSVKSASSTSGAAASSTSSAPATGASTTPGAAGRFVPSVAGVVLVVGLGALAVVL